MATQLERWLAGQTQRQLLAVGAALGGKLLTPDQLKALLPPSPKPVDDSSTFELDEDDEDNDISG